ncbi:MAG: YqgE/AlgH family protein [Acidobacteria bacterium]|nr:YqgE/AlgH family protein [Acidobacteriota bacterium]
MVETSTPLAGNLLIAMPNLVDPNFWRTVVLLGVHGEDEGAFGLVITRPLEVTMADVLREIGEESTAEGYPEVLAGGPVEPTNGFVLFDQPKCVNDQDMLRVGPDMAISGNTRTLIRLARGIPGVRYNLVLGYSGWAPGQLEREIEENSWLVAPASHDLVFETPYEQRWTASLRSIGVDPGTLVDMGSASPS